MINKESLVYEMNLNNNDNIKFEKIRSFKDENMDKFFQDLIKSINKAFVEYKMHYAMDYGSIIILTALIPISTSEMRTSWR